MDLLIRRILLSLFDIRRKRILKRKAKKILNALSSSGRLTASGMEVKVAHKKLWRPFVGRPDNRWLKIYSSISGITSPLYVPEPVYYNHIEPRLNNRVFSKGFNDKNFYSRLPGEYNLPVTIVSNIEGVWYDGSMNIISPEEVSHLINSHSSLIIKPSVDTGGGRGVALAGREHPHLKTAEAMVAVYKKNFIVQEHIIAHPFYMQFSSIALNTVRVLIYRSVTDNIVRPLWTVMRVAKNGSITDNQASGGYACGVGPDGNLTGMAVDKHGSVYHAVNDVPLTAGTPLEGYSEIITMAVSVGQYLPYERLLGLDLCLDTHGRVRLIEINNVNHEINFYQMLYGPLFGDYTGEIRDWCIHRPRSFLIDYEI